MTKEQLMKLAKTYFDNKPGLLKIFGTEDKHFFTEEIHAIRFCKREKEYFLFTREDFAKKKAIPKPKPEEEVKAEVPKEIQKPEAKTINKPKPVKKEG